MGPVRCHWCVFSIASTLLAATADEQLSLLQTRMNVSAPGSLGRQIPPYPPLPPLYPPPLPPAPPNQYDLGFSAGFAAGVTQGNQSGYAVGYAAGTSDAQAQAAAAQAAASQTSYDAGYRNATAAASSAQQQAYTDGFSQGNQSYGVGYTEGYAQGYSQGLSNGSARAWAPLQSVVSSLTEPLDAFQRGADELLTDTTANVKAVEQLAAAANASEAPLLVNASATLLGSALAGWNRTHALLSACSRNMTRALSQHEQSSWVRLEEAWGVALASVRNFTNTIAHAELALGGASAHIVEANSALNEGAQLLGPKKVFSTDFRKMVHSLHTSVSGARDAVRAAETKFDRSLEALGPGLPQDPGQELGIALREAAQGLRITTSVVLSGREQRRLSEVYELWQSNATGAWGLLGDAAHALVSGLETVRAEVETLYPQQSQAVAIGWKVATAVAAVGLAVVLP